MNVNEIADYFMNHFKKMNSKVDHVIDYRWINFHFADRLNPKEKLLINDAVMLLKERGSITVENRAGMLCLVLTQQGFEEIYPDNKIKIINKIRYDIMNKFAINRSQVGDGLDQRWIELTYMMTLNPVEKKYVGEAVKSLHDDGLVVIQMSAIPVLLLTQKGFEEIY